jgi:hypothetical protein
MTQPLEAPLVRWMVLLSLNGEVLAFLSYLDAILDANARPLRIACNPALDPASGMAETRRASAEATRQLLRLVRCTAGARMPGLLASPDCEIAMAASKTGSYHVAQVLLAGEFIRVYPRLRALKPLRTLLWL